jgi:CheY-like chemotaxis protein
MRPGFGGAAAQHPDEAQGVHRPCKQEALRIKEHDFDAIFCDVRLPDIDGPALFAWMTQHRPELCARVAFVTGDTLGHASERFLADARRPLLEKPFLPSDVRRVIDELLSTRQ